MKKLLLAATSLCVALLGCEAKGAPSIPGLESGLGPVCKIVESKMTPGSVCSTVSPEVALVIKMGCDAKKAPSCMSAIDGRWPTLMKDVLDVNKLPAPLKSFMESNAEGGQGAKEVCSKIMGLDRNNKALMSDIRPFWRQYCKMYIVEGSTPEETEKKLRESGELRVNMVSMFNPGINSNPGAKESMIKQEMENQRKTNNLE